MELIAFGFAAWVIYGISMAYEKFKIEPPYIERAKQLQVEVDDLRERNAQLCVDLDYHTGRADRWEALCRQAQYVATAAGPALSKAQIDRLIRLCHPDKHHNSESAKEVTQWLISLRS